MTEAKPSSSTTLEVFASIARRYDLANRITSGGLDQSWRRYAARRLDLPRGATILDIASGTGDLAIADIRYGDAARVVATDVSEEMMEFGRAKIARLGLGDRISFGFADAQALPFGDEHFDGVTVGFGVRNFADRPAAFREIARVLRRGRRLVCLEFSKPRSRVLRALYFFYLRHVIPWLGSLITRERASYQYLADSIQAFEDQESLARMLADAGFGSVEYRNLAFGAVAVHVATK